MYCIKLTYTKNNKGEKNRKKNACIDNIAKCVGKNSKIETLVQIEDNRLVY